MSGLSLTRKARGTALAMGVATLFGFGAASIVDRGVEAQPEAAIESLEQQGQAFQAVAKKAQPAVVHVKVEMTLDNDGGNQLSLPFGGGEDMEGFSEFFRRFMPNFPDMEQGPQQEGPQFPFRQRGQGSGFIVSPDGYVMTNNHVVGNADRVTVVTADDREHEATVVGTDEESDLAILKIDAGDDLPYLPLADSDKTEVGQWVVAIGSPFGLSQTVTAGIVSATGRSTMGGINGMGDFIQTDAAINPGNSGGPLLNIYGEVMGVNTAIMSRTGGYNGIGFAIPSNTVTWIKDQIINEGGVSRGQLGVMIQALTNELKKDFGLDADTRGILIGDVIEGSPADKAGLQTGDVVVALNGHEAREFDAFRSRIAMTAPGEKVSLSVLRNGKERNIDVTLSEKSSQPIKQAVAEQEDESQSINRLGISVQDLTPEVAGQLGFDNDIQGVVIAQVHPRGPAAEVGIRRGHVIEQVDQRPVTSVEEFTKQIERASDDGSVLLLVNDGENTRFVSLRIR
ncbi:MAG: DegQ family serine endoprotease [Candidatus Hydrogenedentales bacterium]